MMYARFSTGRDSWCVFEWVPINEETKPSLSKYFMHSEFVCICESEGEARALAILGNE